MCMYMYMYADTRAHTHTHNKKRPEERATANTLKEITEHGISYSVPIKRACAPPQLVYDYLCVCVYVCVSECELVREREK